MGPRTSRKVGRPHTPFSDIEYMIVYVIEDLGHRPSAADILNRFAIELEIDSKKAQMNQGLVWNSLERLMREDFVMRFWYQGDSVLGPEEQWFMVTQKGQEARLKTLEILVDAWTKE